MISYLIIFILIFIGLVLFKYTPVKLIYIKKTLAFTFIFTFFVFLIIFPGISIKAATKGLNLWFSIIIPSLLPFFVVFEIINKSGIVKLIGVVLEPIMRPLFNVPGCSSLILAAGTFGGYPMGAKLTSDLKKDKAISDIEAERLISFTNNSGPVFIIGAVCAGMLQMPELGPILLICHITSSLTVGILFRFYKKNSSEKVENRKGVIKSIVTSWKSINFSNIGGIIGESVKSSMLVLISVGGFIIVFSVIINLLIETGIISNLSQYLSNILNLPQNSIGSILCGFVELTTGTHMQSQLNIPLMEKLMALSFMIGWSGLSVHMQVISILSSCNIKPNTYILGKTLQSILSPIYLFLYFSISSKHHYINTFKPFNFSLNSYYSHYFMFCVQLGIILLLFTVVAVFVSMLVRTILYIKS